MSYVKRKQVTLFVIVACYVLSSCNNSFTALNRKYRPGFAFLSTTSTGKKENELPSSKVPETTTPTRENKEDALSCSITKDPVLLKNKFYPVPVNMAYDTPPVKKEEEDFYNPKDAEAQKEQQKEVKKEEPKKATEHTGPKKLEPYGFAALIGTLAMLLIGVSGPLVIFIPLGMLALTIISLVRMKRNKGKYCVFSKIIAYILLSFYSLFVLGLLIAFIIILAAII